MDRTQVLATLNGRILAVYSSRTILALRGGLPVRILLGRLEPLLALNVEKEIRKDAIVIRGAADASTARAALTPELLHQLVAATKRIDRDFLLRVRGFPVDIAIRYDDIAPVRAKRIERLFGAACRILDAWRAPQGLRAALCASFPERELEGLLHELLQLYAVETRVLSDSVSLPALLQPVRAHMAQRLFSVMSSVAAALAKELASGAHRRAPRLLGSAATAP